MKTRLASDSIIKKFYLSEIFCVIHPEGHVWEKDLKHWDAWWECVHRNADEEYYGREGEFVVHVQSVDLKNEYRKLNKNKEMI